MRENYVIFDLDGTLANLDHRLHFIKVRPKNWKAFHACVGRDKPIEPVIIVLKALRATSQFDMIILSGRNEETRESTERWLKKHGIEYDEFLMRRKGDFRDDVVVKKEFLDELVEKYGKKPLFAVDDRPRVVKMWKDNGIFVFDVRQCEEEY